MTKEKKPEAPAVFIVHTSSSRSKTKVCADCGAELWKGQFFTKTADESGILCMACSDYDRLVFLPSGDAALTLRARKYSDLSPVVLRFARARKRFERQGVLVDEAALERAEAECLADADARARRRERAAERRQDADKEYVARFAAAIREQYPRCPKKTARAIAAHACDRGSGRVGRSREAKALDPEMIDLAVQAHIRHVETDYDSRLGRGIPRDEARKEVRAEVRAVLHRWEGE